MMARQPLLNFKRLAYRCQHHFERRQDPRLVRRGERPPLRPGRLSLGHLTIMPVIAAWSASVIVTVSVVPSCPA